MDANIQAAAAKLVRRLKEGNHSLTLAESCTGGLLASTLTDTLKWLNQGLDLNDNAAKRARELMRRFCPPPSRRRWSTG